MKTVSVSPSPSEVPRPRKSARLTQKKSAFATDDLKWLDGDSDAKSAVESDEDFSGRSDDEDDNIDDIIELAVNDVDDDEDAAAIDTVVATDLKPKLIYVGIMGPSVAHANIVVTAPERVVRRVILEKIAYNLSTKDKTSVGTSPAKLEENGIVLKETLLQSFSQHDNGMLFHHCDYSGTMMFWTPGPRSPSFEAIYHFVQLRDGSVEYHAVPNVCLISSSLNRIKRYSAPVRLPLVGEWLRTHSDPDFESRKARWAWVYNALTNEAIMCSLFKPSVTSLNFKLWQSWSPAKRQEALETLRTGTMGSFLNERFPFWKSESFHRATSKKSLKESERFMWNSVYTTLQRVAEDFDLSANEFDYYCSIPSPTGHHRVFYPFHILSRPQAQAIGWDWHTLQSFARARLDKMRRTCNRHAENLGLGEKHVDSMALIYWMAAFFCNKIRQVKEERSKIKAHVTPEEIAFHILDRWGMPIIPWARHAFSASLCKGPEHGIAMVFGIQDTGSNFDPTRHIDLGASTIVFDNWTTNAGMFNYPPAVWDDIRGTLSKVPLQHPFWKVDPSMGSHIWLDEAWIGHWDTTITPQAPVPEFATELAPIEAWFPRSDMPATQVTPFKCCSCGADFPNAGALVNHCREAHSGGPDESEHLTNQDAIDAEYWAKRYNKESLDVNKFVCDFPDCGAIFNREEALEIHRQLHTGSSKLYHCARPHCNQSFATADDLEEHRRSHFADRKFPCEVEGCHAAFHKKGHLNEHVRNAHGGVTYSCKFKDCGKSYGNAKGLRTHVSRIHERRERHACTFPGCDKSYPDKSYLVIHMRVHTGEKPYACSWEGCSATFAALNTLRNHERTHTNERPHKCTWEGCSKSFNKISGLTTHQLIHTGERPFKCTWEDCSAAFTTNDHLQDHRLTHIDEKPFKCDWQGCSVACKTKSGLDQHRKTAHTDERPFKCTHEGCSSTFKASGALKKHLRNCHKD